MVKIIYMMRDESTVTAGDCVVSGFGKGCVIHSHSEDLQLNLTSPSPRDLVSWKTLLNAAQKRKYEAIIKTG